MKWNVLSAIFKRDFVSYFSNPTGYVFICVFVVLSALATFWPPEFFATNLANLDQLSRWLPFIMLVFIPAITMGVWAEERRQGTDELLLTIPASDIDVVLGKYLACVAIFTVSLAFSALSIFTVFKYGLGDPDVGLFASTYIGYWFIGIAMIAIGMVASFLTSNLTVGFILGTLFNLPLAAFGVANWFVKDPSWAEAIRRWSAVEQFADFKRGVLSLGGMTYFVMIAAVMIYLSMVLIGRRHWQAREDGEFMLAHYAVRAVALLALAVGVTVAIQDRNWLRADVSSEKLSTLSDDTIDLLKELRENEDVKTITIDAYVSPQVPTDYAAVKLNLETALEEFKALGGGKIRVDLHEIPNFGEEAELAEKNYGITPQRQMTAAEPGAEPEEFFMGLAITSGLDTVVTPFVNKGIPIEYELIRSIMTVSSNTRKKIGVIDTGIRMMSPDGSQRGEWPLITELRKQYEVTSVDASQPIRGAYDALLAVQPSMLSPDAFDHFVDAVRSGVPTAILEDPLPYFYPPSMPGTAEPKQSQQMAMMGMFGGGQEEPKGDIEQLWKLLGIRSNPMEVVWQRYEPEQSVRSMQDDQWVFIDHGNGSPAPFNEDLEISSGLNQLLFLYPGALAKADDTKLKFEQILSTGVGTFGTIMARELQRFNPDRMNANGGGVSRQFTPTDAYILAAQVKGQPPEEEVAIEAPKDETVDPAAAAESEKKTTKKDMHAVVVSDIYWIIPSFFYIREGGEEAFLPATQNVTFILNIIDSLSGDDRFIEIRKRAREHRALAKIDEATRESREQASKDEQKFIEEITAKENDAREAMAKRIDQIESNPNLDERQKEVLLEQARMREQDKLDAQVRSLAADRNRQIKQIEYDLNQNIRSVQDKYKLYAILIPPIPPLLLALAVFFRRRELERQGVARERLR
jgi:ABC-2 type transport system permease protein